MHSFYLLGVTLPLLTLAEKGTLQLPVKHVKQLPKGLSKRGAPDNVPLVNSITGYFVDIEVGTPSQKIQALLDTGSSDLWFPTPSVCSGSVLCSGGSFDPGQSSTFHDLYPGGFNITYEDGSGAVGDYFTDTVTIAGATLTNFTMAVAKEANANGQSSIISVMGVSYSSDEVLVAAGETYRNYPVALVDQGITSTIAYSLFLDDLDASTGSILFSGIDKSKFCGSIEILDVKPEPNESNEITGFWVELSSISITTSSGTLTIASTPAFGVLDSGTSLTTVPKAILQEILKIFPTAKWSEAEEVYTLPCSDSSQTGYFTFTLGSAVIKVDIAEMVVQESGTCILGFLPTSDDLGENYILGDTFLRSAYVVYDLVNNQVGLALASFNSETSNVVPFPSYGAHIPQITGDCSSTTTTGTATKSTPTASTGSATTKTRPTTQLTSTSTTSPPASTATGMVPIPPTTSISPNPSVSTTGSSPPLFTGGASRIGGSVISTIMVVGLAAGILV